MTLRVPNEFSCAKMEISKYEITSFLPLNLLASLTASVLKRGCELHVAKVASRQNSGRIKRKGRG